MPPKVSVSRKLDSFLPHTITSCKYSSYHNTVGYTDIFNKGCIKELYTYIYLSKYVINEYTV